MADILGLIGILLGFAVVTVGMVTFVRALRRPTDLDLARSKRRQRADIKRAVERASRGRR